MTLKPDVVLAMAEAAIEMNDVERVCAEEIYTVDVCTVRGRVVVKTLCDYMNGTPGVTIYAMTSIE